MNHIPMPLGIPFIGPDPNNSVFPTGVVSDSRLIFGDGPMGCERDGLTDEQWAGLAPLMPGGCLRQRGPRTNNRLFIDALLWLARSLAVRACPRAHQVQKPAAAPTDRSEDPRLPHQPPKASVEAEIFHPVNP